MRTSPRRALIGGTLVGGLALCLTATLGWACIGLSTLSSSSSAVSPGQQLEVRGEGYATSGDVAVRVDSPRGEVAAMVAPRSDGTFQTSFALPQLEPGEHVLVATQSGASGVVIKTASLPLVVPGVPSPSPLSRGNDDLAPLSTPPAPLGLSLTLVGPLGLTVLALVLGLASLARRPGFPRRRTWLRPKPVCA